MFPPNATDRDVYDYHDGETAYHLKASEVLVRESNKFIDLARNNPDEWYQLVRRGMTHTNLAKHHNKMARFHLRMMRQVRENSNVSV